MIPNSLIAPMRIEDFLAENAEKKTFPEGRVIFEEGRQADCAYFITRGKVEIFKGPPAKNSVLAVLGPGEIFGEMALLRFDHYTLSARAAADTEVRIITPEMLQTQLRETHPLIRAILDRLVERIHEANAVLIDLDSAQG